MTRRLYLTRAPWDFCGRGIYYLSDCVLEFEWHSGKATQLTTKAEMWRWIEDVDSYRILRMTGPIAPGEFVELGVVGEEAPDADIGKARRAPCFPLGYSELRHTAWTIYNKYPSRERRIDSKKTQLGKDWI